MELFKLMGTIAVDANQAHKAIDDTSAKANNASKQTSSAFSAIGGAALKVGQMAVTAGAALGGAWIAAIEGTREYRAQMGLLDSAFQASGHSSTAAKDTYSALNAVLGDTEQAVEAAQHMALLADNEKELTTWTDIATGVYATFGNSLPIESLAESSQEVSRSGVLTGGLIDALVWAGISEEEFQKKLDACTTEQERQDLIMNTLNGTYSKASEQYKETNKDVMAARQAQEKLTDAMAQLGAIGEPILTAIKDKVADMALAAIPHLQNFIKKVKDLKKWIKDNENTIDAWVAVIIGATVSISAFLLILKWGAIMAAATKAIKAVRSAILLFNAALLANPIALVVALIAGLVAAFVYLWNNNKGFRQFWIDLWAKIRSASDKAITAVKNKFNDLKGAVDKVKQWFKDMGKSISDKMESAQKAVKKVVDKIKGFFPLKIGKIFSGLKIPKISVSGGKAPFGIAGKGSLPSFNVKWNAQGGILTQPTIFGRMGDTLLGGGEAGAEAIAPIALLQDYIRAAVGAENEGIRATMIEQTGLLMSFLSRSMPKAVMLDTGAVVGELTPAIDAGLAERWNNTKRGNTR